jgi:3-hydroxyisobutyrate dehydrogenase-like beta-hydroxyacid dehydrogenase
MTAPAASNAGFVGLGVMGLAIARRLQSAGVRLALWNRSATKADPLVQAGAQRCATPSAVTGQAKLVFLCLLDDKAVERVVFGPDGLAEQAGPDTVFVDHSSIAPDAAREIASRVHQQCGAAWLDAPVSGGTPAAECGALTVMVGGDEVAYERVLPLMLHYARNVNLMGPSGAGQVAKLCNQVLVANALASISEALRLAIRGGIDAKRLPAALQGGWADSSLLQLFVPRMLETPEQSLGASTTMLKDLRNVQAFAAQHEVPTPLTSLTEQLFRVLEYQSRGQCEPSELLRVFDRS